MVHVPGGTFNMGSDGPESVVADGEGPMRTVAMGPYDISCTTVTNHEFARFVDDTNHVTDAERYGWSFVFEGLVGRDASCLPGSVPEAPWWRAVEGAMWRRPEGGTSGIDERLDHPVVHVSWNDARTFADWAGVRLPTEAEWEMAARAGREHSMFPWGNELCPDGEHRCNIWQGSFPDVNTAEDGYLGTAPAAAFSPNDFGLYNTVGNVWEWCDDLWSTSWHAEERTETRTDPRGPSRGESRVMRGGSYLCHASYCNRYRVSARTSNSPDSSSGHTGFRCAR